MSDCESDYDWTSAMCIGLLVWIVHVQLCLCMDICVCVCVCAYFSAQTSHVLLFRYFCYANEQRRHIVKPNQKNVR